MVRADVRRHELARLDVAREEAAGQRRECDEGDSQLVARIQYADFGVRVQREYSLCTAVIGWTACALRRVAGRDFR